MMDVEQQDIIKQASSYMPFSQVNKHGNVLLSDVGNRDRDIQVAQLVLKGKEPNFGKTVLLDYAFDIDGVYRHNFRLDRLVDRPIAFGVSTKKINVAKGLAEMEKKNNSESRLKPQKSSNAVNSWCVYSSKSTKSVIVCPDRMDYYCEALDDGDILGIEIKRKQTEALAVCVYTIRFYVNFIDKGVALEIVTNEELSVALSLYGDQQKVSLYCFSNVCHTAVELESQYIAAKEELVALNTNIQSIKNEVRDHFKDIRHAIMMEEERFIEECNVTESHSSKSLKNQVNMLESLLLSTKLSKVASKTVSQKQVDSNESTIGFDVPCPPFPVMQSSTISKATFAETKPVMIPAKAYEELLDKSQKLVAVESELQKANKNLKSVKSDLEKYKKRWKRANPLLPTDLTYHLSQLNCSVPDLHSKFRDMYIAESAKNNLLLYTNKYLLFSWVEQKSPSCAASAVAGVCNALASSMQDKSFTEEEKGPSFPSHLHFDGADILKFYVSRWEKQLKKIRSDIMGILQIEQDVVLESLENALEERYGKPCELHPKMQGLKSFLSSLNLAGAGVECNLCQEVDDVLLLSKVKSLWGKLGALQKLRGEKPSTAPIGNETIIKAFESIAESHDFPIKVWKFMSTKKAEHQIATSDFEEEIDSQWHALVANVADTSKVLMFHLENHYSIIYAARETNADMGYGGKHHIRQILVAKPGQQPCKWIDFLSVRETITNWVGHCILGIRLDDIQVIHE